MKRFCYQCKDEIFECMGSVHAGSFLNAMKSEDSSLPIYELCPLCATKYANTTGEDLSKYPNPEANKLSWLLDDFGLDIQFNLKV